MTICRGRLQRPRASEGPRGSQKRDAALVEAGQSPHNLPLKTGTSPDPQGSKKGNFVMSDLTSKPATPNLPAIDARLIVTVLVAGAFATIAFDLFGQFLSPLLKDLASPWLGAKLAPVPLANAVIGTVFGVPAKAVGDLGIGYGLHILTGLIFYPLGYVLVARPLSGLLLFVPWWVTGAAYGVALWIFALYFMAHLIAGNPPFLGWGSLTWVALWGHILFGVVVAGVVQWRELRD
jgi:hypothetical protein